MRTEERRGAGRRGRKNKAKQQHWRGKEGTWDRRRERKERRREGWGQRIGKNS